MNKQIYEEWIDELKKDGQIKTASWEKYYRGKYKNVVKLPDGSFIGIEKESTETSFCFGYRLSHTDTEEYDNANKMADYASKSEEYFIKENLKGIEERIKKAKEKQIYIYVKYITSQDDSKIKDYTIKTWYDQQLPKGSREATEEEKKMIIKAMETEKEEFTKRLHTYLKRFGTSKLKTWSYWQDE